LEQSERVLKRQVGEENLNSVKLQAFLRMILYKLFHSFRVLTPKFLVVQEVLNPHRQNLKSTLRRVEYSVTLSHFIFYFKISNCFLFCLSGSRVDLHKVLNHAGTCLHSHVSYGANVVGCVVEEPKLRSNGIRGFVSSSLLRCIGASAPV